MKKKILIIFAVICVIAAGAGYYFYRTQRNVSVGLNKNIQDENGKKGKTSLDSSKVLVVYFSNGGNTQKLAKEIYNQVGGDFRQIKPVKAYPKGNKLYDYTKNEQEKNGRPKLKDLNIDIPAPRAACRGTAPARGCRPGAKTPSGAPSPGTAYRPCARPAPASGRTQGSAAEKRAPPRHATGY